MQEKLDILYREIDGVKLYIDLYLPDAKNPPLILWIHGGAWQVGDRKWCMLKRQAERGYAVASVDYRLSGVARFPAQIQDCKYALWYLKQNAAQYGYDASKIAVGGDSAGGHLAALMGTSIGHADWEPEGSDCSVQAVVDYYGPTMVTYKWPKAVREDSPENQLLGAMVNTRRGRMLAACASPTTYVDGSEPPFQILHGNQDDTVPISQSLLLRDTLEAAGNAVFMHTVIGGGHGFQSEAADRTVDEFLDFYLK